MRDGGRKLSAEFDFTPGEYRELFGEDLEIFASEMDTYDQN